LYNGGTIGGGGAGCGFVGVAWRCWPKDGIGLVVEFGSGMGVLEAEAAALAARFDTICNEYVGYGPLEPGGKSR